MEKSNTIEKQSQEQCPKCESKNINWHDSELQDTVVIYEATCDDCDTDFKEVYKLIYEVSTYKG